eukprot:6187621-Pleurochrysis_carterae.AAC.3
MARQDYPQYTFSRLSLCCNLSFPVFAGGDEEVAAEGRVGALLVRGAYGETGPTRSMGARPVAAWSGRERLCLRTEAVHSREAASPCSIALQHH